MHKRIALTSIALFAIVFNTLGQKLYRNGFIIDLKKDTLYGLVIHIDGNKAPKKIAFKRFDIATPREYNPKELLGFGYKNGNYFESKTISNKKVLVRCYVKGEISLYANGNKIYVEKGNTKPIEISKNEIIIKPNQKFSDHVDLLKHLTSDIQDFIIPSNLATNTSSLANIISDYHKVAGKPYHSFKSLNNSDYSQILYAAKYSKQSIGFSIGRTRANASFEVNDNTFTSLNEPSISNSIKLGFFYNHLIFRTSNRFALQLEFLVFENNFKVYRDFKKISPERNLSLDIIKTQLKVSVPIKLVYTLPLGKLHPFASIGFSYNFVAKEDKAEYLDLLHDNNDIYTYTMNKESYIKEQDRVRFITCLGCKYKISQSSFIFANLNAEAIWISSPGAFFPIFTATDSFSFDYMYSPTIFLKRKSPIISINIGIGINI